MVPLVATWARDRPVRNGDVKQNMKPKIVSIPVADWDAAKPAESFRAFGNYVHGQAKEILLKDGHHSEMLFFIPLDGNGHVVLWRSNDRDLEADWLRRHAAERYAYGVVHVVEAWMHLAPKPGDHTLKQIMDGEIKVSELKPGDRKEVLMVSAQSRDGWANSWNDEILRGPGGKPIFGACLEVSDFRGRFGRVFG